MAEGPPHVFGGDIPPPPPPRRPGRARVHLEVEADTPADADAHNEPNAPAHWEQMLYQQVTRPAATRIDRGLDEVRAGHEIAKDGFRAVEQTKRELARLKARGDLAPRRQWLMYVVGILAILVIIGLGAAGGWMVWGRGSNSAASITPPAPDQRIVMKPAIDSTDYEAAVDDAIDKVLEGARMTRQQVGITPRAR